MSTSEQARQQRWDQYFMELALCSARRSRDPLTQVGCCLVNERNQVLALGYNGMIRTPAGTDNDQLFPWGKSAQPLDSKHSYVVHAELNTLLNTAASSVRGCTLYTTLHPCNECSKALVQAGISTVVYWCHRPTHPAYIAAERLLRLGGVQTRVYHPQPVDAMIRVPSTQGSTPVQRRLLQEPHLRSHPAPAEPVPAGSTSSASCSTQDAEQPSSYEAVHQPAHYHQGGLALVDVIHAYGLHTDHYRATILKYLLRAGRKPGNSLLQDLQKAQWYLDHYIQFLTADEPCP